VNRRAEVKSEAVLPDIADEESHRQHEAIRRGMSRSNMVTAVAFGISVALALLAVYFGFRAGRMAQSAAAATSQSTVELWNARLAQARALRWSGKVGRREEGLEAIRQAAQIRPAKELRDEAIATLALMDLQPGGFWQPMPSRILTVNCSGGLELYAWGDEAGVVELYRAEDRVLLGQFALENRPVMSLEFSPDQRYLAARHLGGAVQVWDTLEQRLVFAADARLPGYHHHSLRFHPAEPYLLVAGVSNEVQVVDTRTWREQPPLRVNGNATVTRFEPTGKRVAVAVGWTVEVWDFAARQRLQVLDAGGAMTDLAWRPGEDLLAAAHADGNITLIDRRSGRRKTLRAHTRSVTHTFFDPQGGVLVSTSWDGTTRFWDARSGRPLLTTQAGYAFSFDSTGRRIFYFKERLGIGDWAYVAPTGFDTLAVPIGNSDRVLGVDFSPDGRWLAATSAEGVHLWDRAKREHRALAPLADSQRAAFAADNQSLVVSSGRGLHRLPLETSADTRAVRFGDPELLPDTEGRAFWMGFVTSGKQRWFASAAPTEIAAVRLGEPPMLLRVAGGASRCAASISPDGRYLAVSVWKGGGTRVWDTEIRQQIASFNDEGGLVTFRPDGQCLVVGTAAEFLFYDAKWQLTQRVERDVASALSGIAAFSPDGARLALTHTVRQAQLLTSDARTVLANLHAPHPEHITDLSFSQDGQCLAASTDNREIQLWDLAVLQRELAALALDWDSDPTTTPPLPGSASQPAIGALWLAGIGAGLAGLFAFYSLRHHRRLIVAYAEVEAAAADNRRQLRSAHTQLLHSQKMKALGTLAAGIAHDFNNLLSIIRMAAQLVARELKPAGPARQNLEDIEQAAVQGKNIVRSILGYSRQPGDPSQPYSVNAVVGETLAMLSRQFLSGIVLTLELAPETPAVCGDKSRLEQILLNLIVNASEAMSGTGNLSLIVRPLCDARARILPPRPADEYAELIVKDQGPGIPPEILPRIFEPFFSTKHTGKQHGTGLGLTMVYSIAQQDGLGLDLETAPGEGTSFRVLLPANSRGRDPGADAQLQPRRE
jgi:signal transduction histidine kinase